MVRAYVEAGFDNPSRRQHALRGRSNVERKRDGRARRGTVRYGETARGMREIVYVIGTEVPIPGGELQVLDGLAVTRPEAAARTVDLHRAAFAKRGIGDAMGQVIGLVVQPGVDMGNDQVFAFNREKAAALSAAVRDIPGVVYEGDIRRTFRPRPRSASLSRRISAS